MSSLLRVIFRKELKDSLRDRRSMMAAIIFSVAGPFFVAIMMNIMLDRETSDEAAKIQVEGMEYAGDLVSNLLQGNFVIESDAPVVLQIPSDYAEKFQAGKRITLNIRADESKSKVRRDARRLQTAITQYATDLGQFRLALRSVSASVIQPITVQMQNTATPEARGSLILGIIVVYLLLAAFVGSMPVSIDVSAGERERNSLEVLMAQPVSALAVFSGKWLVAALFGFVGILMVLLASLLMFELVPMSGLGFTIDLGTLDAAVILINLLPLAGFAAAAQIMLAMYAKTYKEASAYLNMLSFVPAAVAFVVLIKEWEPESWMYAVPLLGHQQMVRTVIRGEELLLQNVGLLVISTLAITAVMVWLGSQLLKREKIIFGQAA